MLCNETKMSHVFEIDLTEATVPMSLEQVLVPDLEEFTSLFDCDKRLVRLCKLQHQSSISFVLLK